jgi:hypothetical protein
MASELTGGGNDSDPEPSLLIEFFRSASPEVLGALASVALGAAVAGPIGAVAGAVVGPLMPALASTLEEYQRRAGKTVEQVFTWDIRALEHVAV